MAKVIIDGVEYVPLKKTSKVVSSEKDYQIVGYKLIRAKIYECNRFLGTFHVAYTENPSDRKVFLSPTRDSNLTFEIIDDE